MADSQQKPQVELSSLESITARSKAFAIPELLETILAHLPARDLLMCESINKTWHDVIKKSKTLQEKLFNRVDLVTLTNDMVELDLEINPFFLLVQRRWSFAVHQEGAANGFEGLDYPEASWKKMYLSRPAFCTMYVREEYSKGSNLLQQVLQHDTIKMYHLGDGRPRLPAYVRFSQSGGIRMHHLLGMDPSTVFFLISLVGHIMRVGQYSWE